MRTIRTSVMVAALVAALVVAWPLLAQERVISETVPVLRATDPVDPVLLEDADAVILSRDTDVDIPNDRSRVTVQEVWMKILTGNGKNLYGDLKVLFDQRFETVELLSAETQTPDGRLMPLMDGADNEIIPPWLMDAAVYGAIRQRIVSFSGVEPGTIIHYKVKMSATYPADERPLSGHHIFQDAIPVLREDLRIHIPASVPFTYAIAGNLETPSVSKGRVIEYAWSREDTAMVRSEWGSAPEQNVVPRLQYSCARDWTSAAGWLRSRFMRAVEAPFDTRELLGVITAGCVTDIERAAAIYYWVSENIRMIEIPVQLAGYDPTPPAQTLERRFGDTRDKTVLLMALYRAAGIAAELVLFNRDSLIIEPSVPSIEQFDSAGCIVELTAKRRYWLDPGLDNLPFGFFIASAGRKALRIGQNRHAIESIPVLPPEASQSKLEMNLVLDETGRISGEITWMGEGYFSYWAREENRDLSPEERYRAYERQLVQCIPGAIIGTVTESDWNDMTESPRIRIAFSGGRICPEMGDLSVIEIPVFRLPFARIPVLTSMPERMLPMRLDSTARETVSVSVTLPETLDILQTPKNADARFKHASWQIRTRMNGHVYRHDEMVRWAAVDIDPAGYREIRRIRSESERLEHRVILVKPARGIK